ncbi:MAG: ribulose-phosphate 3-epimerase [Lactovum sp.]
MNKFCIAPSLLSSNFGKFAEESKRLEKSGADYLHIDVMDGHFVSNLTFGAGVVAALRPETKLLLDCHLMVERPENYVDEFVKAGADILSVHVEATAHLHAVLQKIKSHGIKASVVINPATPVSAIVPVLRMVDMVLVMTVNPGFGGQKFLPECLEKIKELTLLKEKLNLTFDIEVDGGINDETIVLAKEAGANIFVAGNFIFSSEYMQQINKLREKLEN